MKYVIRGAQVVEPRQVVRKDIRVEEGRILEIGKVRAPAGARVIDARGLYALPGFIDLHTHGALGFDATTGLYNRRAERFETTAEAYARMVPQVMKHMARHGVTRALLATLAAPDDDLCLALGRLADYAEDPQNGKEGARLEGANIEGTFLLKPARAGAQNPANFRAPDKAFFRRIQSAARGQIRYVNVVPEFGPPAVAFTRWLTRQGVLVGAGHTECSADQTDRCIAAGCRLAVHFLNGSIGASFKPFEGGNAVEAGLRNDDFSIELICDGFHVAPAYVRDAMARKGLDRVVLVTDAVFVAGARGIRRFTLAGIDGELHASGKYLRMKGNSQVLFGSVLTLSAAFSNALSWLTQEMEGVWCRRHRALPLNEALVAVARCCATNPARLLGMDRPGGSGPLAHHTGAIEAGRTADLVLAGLAGGPGAYALRVKHTFVAGRQVV